MASASLPRSHTYTLVKPTTNADNYALLPYETYAGTWAFPYAGYTPYVFYYEALDVEALKAALLEVLNHYPAFAGRISAAGSEINYSSSNQGGVPFIVETLDEDAPQHVAECNESAMLTLADVRCPHHVSAGSEPVATVKVTRYREGRAADDRPDALLVGRATRGRLARGLRGAPRDSRAALLPVRGCRL